MWVFCIKYIKIKAIIIIIIIIITTTTVIGKIASSRPQGTQAGVNFVFR
jgi:hypothetical protein